MAAALTTSCVIPIPATPEVDGGSGPSDPFLAASTPAMPGPIRIDLAAEKLMSFTLKDANVADTLYVRVFRDYTRTDPRGPIDSFAITNDPVDGEEERTFIRNVRSWCNDAPVNQQVVFEAIIADQPFDENPGVDPFFQAVTNSGRWSRAAWTGLCLPD